ncbi:MAG: putative metal-binding motif-containing protein [Methanoregula sp.]
MGPQGPTGTCTCAISVEQYNALEARVAALEASHSAGCGDGTCSGAENSQTCPADCPAAVCGDGICTDGETCPADCSGCFDSDQDGYSTCDRDCNDNDRLINPGAVESCDAIDNNCDGSIDEGFPELGNACDGTDTDVCKDGLLVCSPDKLSVVCNDSGDANLEICDGRDNDCDGTIDEGTLCLAGEQCQEGACTYLESCAAIHTADPSATSGAYTISTGQVCCDMVTNGGMGPDLLFTVPCPL